VKRVADDNELSFACVKTRNDLGVKPTVGFVPVLFRSDPFAVLRVVYDDELRPVLEMSKSANLLAA
jgi:hypothetical protein